MATIKTTNTGTALLVTDLATKAPIELPLHAQEAIMAPIVNLREWINKYVRTGGVKLGEMVPGGKAKYYAYPKQTKADRDYEITYDDTTGKINGGMFGAEASGLVGGIDSTYGSKLVSDEITLQPAKFLKHRFSNADAEAQGLGTLISMKLADWTSEIAEDALVELKGSLVAAVGTKGTWASSDATWVAVVPAGAGVRNKAKDYANGKTAVKDIIDTLVYRDNIGLKGTAEESYPLARGLNSASSARIIISAAVNALILKDLEDSANGFLSGVGTNKETGIVTSISYLGQTVQVEVVTDMPQKAGKDFNWMVLEVGKHGAMAMPNKFTNKSTTRPSYETISTEFQELEAVGLVAGLKFLQPELIFASFKGTARKK